MLRGFFSNSRNSRKSRINKELDDYISWTRGTERNSLEDVDHIRYRLKKRAGRQKSASQPFGEHIPEVYDECVPPKKGFFSRILEFIAKKLEPEYVSGFNYDNAGKLDDGAPIEDETDIREFLDDYARINKQHHEIHKKILEQKKLLKEQGEINPHFDVSRHDVGVDEPPKMGSPDEPKLVKSLKSWVNERDQRETSKVLPENAEKLDLEEEGK